MAAHEIYGKTPFGVVNRWLAADLEEQGIMIGKITGVDGKLYSRIIPASEQQGINDSRLGPSYRQAAYIVYNVDDDDAIESHYKKNEGIVYAVFSPDPQKIVDTIYCAQDLFSRRDWSVEDLNNFDPTGPFEFLNMKFEEITGLEPVKQEDGRWGSMIYVRYEYAARNIIGTPGAKGQGRRA